MASSRKPPSASLAVALSGGVDSVVLLHLLKSEGFRPAAVHVHHGLSPNADAWADFCRKLCRRWGVPLSVHRAQGVAVLRRKIAQQVQEDHRIDAAGESGHEMLAAQVRGEASVQPLP